MTDDEAMAGFRALVFSGIARALEIDAHCKSYEGRVAVVYPSYFSGRSDDKAEPAVTLQLHCYVLGPHRHYEWPGDTLQEAIRAATVDVKAWIEELENT
jgi:hypothetical protein